jgi:hypothetical protein
MECSSTLFSRFPKQLLLNLVRKSGLLFTLQRDLHLETPDGEVSASIFFLIGSCPGKDREFGHTSHLHSSRYKSTGLNHRVGRDLSIYPASLASFLFFSNQQQQGPCCSILSRQLGAIRSLQTSFLSLTPCQNFTIIPRRLYLNVTIELDNDMARCHRGEKKSRHSFFFFYFIFLFFILIISFPPPATGKFKRRIYAHTTMDRASDCD